ncbi:MAG: class I tRNA ligase family protein, partial [bacterium]|nr:class I tRNA ligase family protein [bacterium]
FMSLACEHPQLMALAKAGGREKEVKKFVEKTLKMERMQRLTGEYEKEGEFTGSYCLHPVTGEKLPIYAANFVLMDYGTGAVMAVPAHDERDRDFAKKYRLPIQEMEPDLNAINIIEKQGFGSKTIQFKLKDWCLSRQRYWGTPIPVIYCDHCGIVPVPEKDLPVKLPTDVPFTGEGGAPLAKIADFVNVNCPQCGKKARRETDTMDTFVESSWYLLRYVSPKYEKGMVDPKAVDYWMPVDQYIGGIEHAVGHLIYCRFFTKVMRDLGMIQLNEPVKNLLTQGMVCLGGSAMSKSKGNVVDPDEIIKNYGADTARIFILFAAPPEKDLEWNEEAVEGMYRFLNRVWRLITENGERKTETQKHGERKTEEWRNRTIKRVTEDIEKFQFNTAIAALMEYLNYLQTRDHGPGTMDLKTLVILLSPFAPHIAEELWEILGHKESILKTPWPKWDEKALQAATVTVVVQVNGKLRGSMELPAGSDEATIKDAALALEKVKP